MIIFVVFSWTFYTVFDQQMFPDFYTSFFADPATGQHAYGILDSFQVFLEVLMMDVVPIIMRKVGAPNTLMLGVTIMFLRISLCGLLDGAAPDADVPAQAGHIANNHSDDHTDNNE